MTLEQAVEKAVERVIDPGPAGDQNQRKALKAAMAVMPAIDMPYIIKGNMVILQDEEENDTLYISADRNSLSGIYRGKKK